MSGSALQSSSSGLAPAIVPASVRADSEVRASFALTGDATRLRNRFERGSLRLRTPRSNGGFEAVLVNTGGGIAGGDRLRVDLSVEAGASLTATSQAAEKIYRAEHEPVRIDVRLRLGDAARLDWLPQETIVYDRASAHRTMSVEVAGSARLTMLEILILGRLAHGENVRQADWHDRWRIRRDDRLIFADDVRLTGCVSQTMQRPAVGDGARCIATLVHVAPDAERRIGEIRERLATARCTAAASAFDGMVIARFIGRNPALVRTDAISVAMTASGAPMPRAWSC